MPLEGFEPSIPYGHRILSAARIPVPTQRRENPLFYSLEGERQFFWRGKFKERKISLRLADGKESFALVIFILHGIEFGIIIVLILDESGCNQACGRATIFVCGLISIAIQAIGRHSYLELFALSSIPLDHYYTGRQYYPSNRHTVHNTTINI